MAVQSREAPRHLERLERWLTSIPTRVLLGVGFVAVMSAFGVAQAYDSFGERFSWLDAEMREEGGIHFGWMHSFARFSMYWGIWGLAAFAIVPCGLWLATKFQSWLLFLALQLPLSFGVGWGVGELHTWGIDNVLGSSPETEALRTYFETRRPPSRRGDGRRMGDGEARGARGNVQGNGRGGTDRPAGGRFGDGRSRDGRRGSGRGGFGRPDQSPLGGAPRGLFAYWFVLALGAGAHLFLRGRAEERRSAELGLAASQLETELATARLASLRNQLHPHFLFNSLHSVGGMIRAGEKGGALTALANIGDLLRKTLEIGEEQELSLDEELSLAKRYLEVEGVRLAERLSIEIDVPAELGSAMVPALLLLPLVENAIRHGIAPRTEGGTLSISARMVGERLEISVVNDGIGFDPEGNKKTRGTGIGLSNTRQRLAALYEGDAELRIESHEHGGTRVVVSLPCDLDA